MRNDVDIELNFYCEKCGSPMDNYITYDGQWVIIRIKPCENCLEEARIERTRREQEEV